MTSSNLDCHWYVKRPIEGFYSNHRDILSMHVRPAAFVARGYTAQVLPSIYARDLLCDMPVAALALAGITLVRYLFLIEVFEKLCRIEIRQINPWPIRIFSHFLFLTFSRIYNVSNTHYIEFYTKNHLQEVVFCIFKITKDYIIFTSILTPDGKERLVRDSIIF